MDIWNKARSLGEEAAKRSSELSIGSAKLRDIVTEAMKRSKEIAVEASKRAEDMKAEAAKQAVLIKSSLAPLQNTEKLVEQEKEPERFGINEELRDFVKGITFSTFQDFPLPDDSPMSDVPTVSNVRQDLTEWQEKHANLVLSTVKEISKLRFELCPRVMREEILEDILYTGKQSRCTYMEEVERRLAEEVSDQKVKESSNIEMTSQQQTKETKNHSKTSTAFNEQDLDVFLLGGDSDEGPDDGDEGFDNDFGKMADSSDDEKVKS